MTEQQVKAIFLLAGLDVIDLYKIENKYWPDHPDFAQVKRDNPWWLVRISRGLIEIGWRKRVISIDWKDTKVSFPLLTNSDYYLDNHPAKGDDVTQWETGTHAYGFSKAVEYLSKFERSFGRFDYVNSQEGKERYALEGKATTLQTS